MRQQGVTSAGQVLLAALDRYRLEGGGATYDETLDVVVERVRAVGCLTKADIGSLVLWKRITAQTTWARALGATPDGEVRRLTAKAYELANSGSDLPEAGQQARWALNDLPGMSSRSEGALASAVLVACAPDRMAVWDRRVRIGLQHPAIALPVNPGKRYYGRFLEAVVQLQDSMSSHGGAVISPRDVDLALWQLGTDRGLARMLGSQ